MFSLSQSSFAALLVGLAVLAALRWKPWPVLAAAGLAAAVAVALVLFAPGALNLETGSERALDRATSGRVDLIDGGLRMVRDRPVFGFGSGSYAERYRERERVSSEKVAAASHTIPLTVTAEQGVIGLAAYLVLVGLSFALLFDRLRSRLASAPWPGVAAVTLAGLAAAYTALLLHTLVYAAYLEDPLSWALLAVAAGLRARPLGGDEDDRAVAGEPRMAVALVTVVRPEFEPTLPALVRRRFGVRERVTVGLVVGAVVLIAVAALVVRPRVDSVSKLSYDGEPAFNLLYANRALHEADPRPGELTRLEGRRGRQSVTITVRPLALPPYEGDVAHGLLPVYASRHIESLAQELDRFRLLEEHRTRINGAPGYEVRFRYGQRRSGPTRCCSRTRRTQAARCC